MLNKCFLSKGIYQGLVFHKLNEDPVWEMTIGHPPQREEIDPGPLSQPRIQNPVAQRFKEFFLHFLSFIFHLPPLPSIPLFLNPQALKSKLIHQFQFHCQSFARRKPIPVFDPRAAILQQLDYGSRRNLGIQILLIPDHPTVARITTIENRRLRQKT